MKIKVYLGDWFYNMGIIGFLRIMKDYGKEVKQDKGFITFDSEELVGFEEIYFSYFMKQYDVYERISKNLDKSLEYVKAHPDKLKDTAKRIKEEIKRNADKVKKIDESLHQTLAEKLKEIGSLKKEEEIERLGQLVKESLDIFKMPIINERLTANLYKFIVGENFFGQVSYFNVAKSSLGLEALKETMYKDYLSEIIDYGRLYDLLEKQDEDGIKQYIGERLKVKDIGANIKKIFKTIDKILKKGTLQEVKTYLESDELASCEMCGNYSGIVEDYTESHFAPLAVSSGNARNMYWNMNTDYSICAICKLILFCTPAGTTHIYKGYLKDEENEFYTFVNMDGSVKELFNMNQSLMKSRDKENPFEVLIQDLVQENNQKSEWQLSNILFIEFKASVGEKKCTLNYFNMPMYLAQFFSRQDKQISSIYNSKLRASVVDQLIKQRDLKYLLIQILHEKIKDILEDKKGFSILGSDCYKIAKIRFFINRYKGGKLEVNDKKLKVVRYAGENIREKYIKANSKNKLGGIAYRLLNTAKVGNKKDFLDTMLRVFAAVEEDVPLVFVDIMAEKELSFEDIAYTFISGLMSDKYDPDKANNKEDK